MLQSGIQKALVVQEEQVTEGILILSHSPLQRLLSKVGGRDQGANEHRQGAREKRRSSLAPLLCSISYTPRPRRTDLASVEESDFVFCL